jgi:integrase
VVLSCGLMGGPRAAHQAASVFWRYRMAQLLFTTDRFQPFDRPVPGVPMLLDANMRLAEPACAWLLHIALVRGRTRSVQTWRTYGEALYDWWQTLEANGWAWDRIGFPEIAAYRDGMLTRKSQHTGRPYARSTINGRLRILALFYRWCSASGLVATVPFSSEDMTVGRSRPAPFFAHLDARGGRQTVNSLTVRETRALPRPLAPDAIRRVVARLNTRDRLIVEWAALTGMRRMEVAGLRKTALTKSAGLEFTTAPVVAIRLDVTKGDKVRHVYPPLPLVDRTHAFVREERAAIVARARRRAQTYYEPEALFLTNRGDPMSPRGIGAMFARAGSAAGVEATFHGLRHTFAGVMMRSLQRQAERNPEMNPLLALQTILGHADLATTSIYLKMVATDLAAIETAVDDLFNALG